MQNHNNFLYNFQVSYDSQNLLPQSQSLRIENEFRRWKNRTIFFPNLDFFLFFF